MRPQQSQTPELVDSRQAIRDYYLADEHKVIHEMIAGAQLSQAERDAISARAAEQRPVQDARQARQARALRGHRQGLPRRRP